MRIVGLKSVDKYILNINSDDVSHRDLLRFIRALAMFVERYAFCITAMEIDIALGSRAHVTGSITIRGIEPDIPSELRRFITSIESDQILEVYTDLQSITEDSYYWQVCVYAPPHTIPPRSELEKQFFLSAYESIRYVSVPGNAKLCVISFTNLHDVVEKLIALIGIENIRSMNIAQHIW